LKLGIAAGNQFIDMLEATLVPAMGPLTMGSVMVYISSLFSFNAHGEPKTKELLCDCSAQASITSANMVR
jgi:hypothetical protein